MAKLQEEETSANTDITTLQTPHWRCRGINTMVLTTGLLTSASKSSFCHYDVAIFVFIYSYSYIYDISDRICVSG